MSERLPAILISNLRGFSVCFLIARPYKEEGTNMLRKWSKFLTYAIQNTYTYIRTATFIPNYVHTLPASSHAITPNCTGARHTTWVHVHQLLRVVFVCKGHIFLHISLAWLYVPTPKDEQSFSNFWSNLRDSQEQSFWHPTCAPAPDTTALIFFVVFKKLRTKASGDVCAPGHIPKNGQPFRIVTM